MAPEFGEHPDAGPQPPEEPQRQAGQEHPVPPQPGQPCETLAPPYSEVAGSEPVVLSRRTALGTGIGLGAAALVTGTLAYCTSGSSEPGPDIISTLGWGAAGPAGRLETINRRPEYLVIHNTETSNDRPTTRAAGIELAQIIQRHHLDQQWADTGQHFTVSLGGFLLEGRHGSLEAARRGTRFIVGAHAPGCNRNGIGIETEGTYAAELPPSRQRAALVELVAWLCSQYRIPVAKIVGHRDCPESRTTCPGDRFEADLPNLRREVAARL